MARETKTIQCYPDDAKINAEIKRYEAFGWELINNQRCQEYEGTYDGYKHWSTFNKLTFSRDKSATWYSKVMSLESDYERIMNTEPCRPSVQKSSWIRWLIVLALCVLPLPIVFTIGGAIGIGIGVGIWVVALLIIILGIRKNIYYKKRVNDYYDALRVWKSTEKPKADEIMAKSEAIINGDSVYEQPQHITSGGSNGELREIFCTQCGTKNNGNNSFCSKCGQKL